MVGRGHLLPSFAPAPNWGLGQATWLEASLPHLGSQGREKLPILQGKSRVPLAEGSSPGCQS